MYPPIGPSIRHRVYTYVKAMQVKQRVADLIHIDMELAETMQVLSYGQGQHYHAHHDLFDPRMYPQPLYVGGVNRFITVFFYLKSTEKGGETSFPRAENNAQWRGDMRECGCGCGSGVLVAPQLEDAVIWYNLEADGHMLGKLDYNSLHGACDPAIGNEKWGANYWI